MSSSPLGASIKTIQKGHSAVRSFPPCIILGEVLTSIARLQEKAGKPLPSDTSKENASKSSLKTTTDAKPTRSISSSARVKLASLDRSSNNGGDDDKLQPTIETIPKAPAKTKNIKPKSKPTGRRAAAHTDDEEEDEIFDDSSSADGVVLPKPTKPSKTTTATKKRKVDTSDSKGVEPPTDPAPSMTKRAVCRLLTIPAR